MGSFYRGGRLWSSDTLHLQASKTLTGTDETTLAAQPGPVAHAALSVVSSSADDATTELTARTLVGTIVASGPISPGDTLELSIAGRTYDYAITGLESGPADVFDTLAGTASTDADFTVTSAGTELHLAAKVPGTAANAITVTFTWTVLTSGETANLANTPAVNTVGPGARTVLIEYLDAAGATQKATMTLSGTTPVTGAQATFIQRVTVLSTGSNGTTGTLTAKIGSTTYTTIAPGDVQSHDAAYVVPAGKQLRLTGVLVTADATTRIRVRTSYDPETQTSFQGPHLSVADFIATATPVAVQLPYACGPFPAGSYVAVTAQGANSTAVLASLDGFLEPEGAR